MSKRSFELFKEKRAERMRLGNAVCEIVDLLSQPDMRVALVPLTDAEFQNSLMAAAQANVTDLASTHEVFYRDRIQKCAIILASAREPDDLSKPFFETLQEVTEMDYMDINHLFSYYEQMIEFSSPKLENLSEEELSEIKKVLLEMDWSALSGGSWYAAKRFLSSLTPTLPPVNSPGFTPTSNLTGMNEEEEFIPSA